MSVSKIQTQLTDLLAQLSDETCKESLISYIGNRFTKNQDLEDFMFGISQWLLKYYPAPMRHNMLEFIWDQVSPYIITAIMEPPHTQPEVDWKQLFQEWHESFVELVANSSEEEHKNGKKEK